MYDGNTVILELDSDNEETARNVYGRNPITRETPDNKVVYGYNGHGDVVNYTNINGQVLQLYAYDEFGNVVLDSYIGIINACHINRFFQITETRS